VLSSSVSATITICVVITYTASRSEAKIIDNVPDAGPRVLLYSAFNLVHKPTQRLKFSLIVEQFNS
jgi:hypothetical protein